MQTVRVLHMYLLALALGVFLPATSLASSESDGARAGEACSTNAVAVPCEGTCAPCQADKRTDCVLRLLFLDLGCVTDETGTRIAPPFGSIDSSNPPHAMREVGLSLGLLANEPYAHVLYGLEAALFSSGCWLVGKPPCSSLLGHSVKGFQLAGLHACAEDLAGAQFAVVRNNARDVLGIQAAFRNSASNTLCGVQFGADNEVLGKGPGNSVGGQFALFWNEMTLDASSAGCGIQLSAGVNHTSGRFRGVQIGALNLHEGPGCVFQLGLVNGVVGNATAVQVGLLNGGDDSVLPLLRVSF